MKRAIVLLILLILTAVFLWAAVAIASAKTVPVPRQATQVGRLEIVVQPGDNLYPIDLVGFTDAPVIVCSPANEQVGVACQALSATNGAVWVRSEYSFPVPVTVNWIAEGN